MTDSEDAQFEGDDDDEFGDFEEATVSAESPTIKEPDDPFPETPTTNSHFGFAKFEDSPKLTPQRSFEGPISTIPSLTDLIADDLLWEYDDAAASSMVEGSVDGIEYFLPYDDGKYSEDIDLPKTYLDSLKLWSEICFVEDTAALKFQWSKSKLSEGMLLALNMNSAKATPRESVPLPMLIPSSPLPLQLDLPETRFKPNDELSSHPKPGQQQQRRNDSSTTPAAAASSSSSTIDPSTVDSLSVPPVNFDWHSSGLSNPLTGASISDLSVILDCNFDTKNDNGNLIEEELERLGLGKSAAVSSTNTQELSFGNSNGIDLDEMFRSQAAANSGTKVIAELSVDAKALLNALPNYNFMLSKMLMFPLNK